MTTILKTAGLSLLVILSAGYATAGTVYTNGPVDGTTDAFLINFGSSVSNSFVVSQTAEITEVEFGLWAFPDATLSSVDWLVGTSPFGGDTAFGTSAVSQSFLFTNSFDFDVAEARFNLGGSLTLNAGTYYLTLQNAVGTDGNPFYWDQNSGPSTAFSSDLESIPSESFTIVNSPEPKLWYMVLPVMAFMIYRRRRQAEFDGPA